LKQFKRYSGPRGGTGRLHHKHIYRVCLWWGRNRIDWCCSEVEFTGWLRYWSNFIIANDNYAPEMALAA